MSDDLQVVKLSSAEYEIQHYGISVSNFISQFDNGIISTICNLHKEMEECVIRKLQLTDEKKEKLHTQIQILTEKYKEIVGKTLKKHNDAIYNFFRIPQNIVLNNDKIHQEIKNVSEEKLLEDISELEKQYTKEQYLFTLYENELTNFEEISQTQNYLSKFLPKIDKMNKILNYKKEVDDLRNIYNKILDNTDMEKFSRRNQMIEVDANASKNKKNI